MCKKEPKEKTKFAEKMSVYQRTLLAFINNSFSSVVDCFSFIIWPRLLLYTCILVCRVYICTSIQVCMYTCMYTWRWIKVWLSGYYYLAAVTSDQSELAHLHLSIISFTYKESNNNNQTILVDGKYLNI